MIAVRVRLVLVLPVLFASGAIAQSNKNKQNVGMHFVIRHDPAAIRLSTPKLMGLLQEPGGSGVLEVQHRTDPNTKFRFGFSLHSDTTEQPEGVFSGRMNLFTLRAYVRDAAPEARKALRKQGLQLLQRLESKLQQRLYLSRADALQKRIAMGRVAVKKLEAEIADCRARVRQSPSEIAAVRSGLDRLIAQRSTVLIDSRTDKPLLALLEKRLSSANEQLERASDQVLQLDAAIEKFAAQLLTMGPGDVEARRKLERNIAAAKRDHERLLLRTEEYSGSVKRLAAAVHETGTKLRRNEFRLHAIERELDRQRRLRKELAAREDSVSRWRDRLPSLERRLQSELAELHRGEAELRELRDVKVEIW